jgi:hypothetical protein
MSLLTNIAHNREASSLVLLEDDATHSGHVLRDVLLRLFLSSSSSSSSSAVLVRTARNAPHARLEPRVVVVDAFSDPLGWGAEPGAENSRDLQRGEHAHLVVSDPDFFGALARRVACALQASGGSGGGGALVVIEDLTPLLAHLALPCVCAGLRQLSALSGVSRVVALVHRDLHGRRVLASLAHMAATVVRLNAPGPASALGALVPTCSVTHCRRTGKVLTSLEAYTAHSSAPYLQTRLLSKDAPQEAEPEEAANPAADLTFNLTLNEKERTARASVEKRRTGQIIYQAEAGDNFDEEEPDDDLLI